MANSSVISNRSEWFFDPFQGMGGSYAGAGGGAGAALGGIATIGAALAKEIVQTKTNKAHLENLKPGTENKTETEVKPIPDGIPSDLAEPGVQELPYLPNAGAKPQVAEKEATLPTIPPISEGLTNTETSIKDETNTNIESAISPGFDMQSMYDFILAQQQRQWDREDSIRAETQAREDNAYQRAVEDMKKAGINPNLVGVNPAASGGGITNATGLDYSPWTAEVNKNLALLEQEIQNGFQGDENAKDRFTKGLTSILQLFAFMAMKG